MSADSGRLLAASLYYLAGYSSSSYSLANISSETARLDETPSMQVRKRFAKSGVGYGSSRVLSEIVEHELAAHGGEATFRRRLSDVAGRGIEKDVKGEIWKNLLKK